MSRQLPPPRVSEAYLIDGVRSPIGKWNGSLSHLRCDDLAAAPLRELTRRHAQIPADRFDEVILGCANQAGEDNRNVARMALLLAGLPPSVPGETVNRLCASGMSAVVAAARAIWVGDGDLYLAGGAEHMTRGPFVLPKADRAFTRNLEMFDTSLGWRFVNPEMERLYGTESMGCTAENLVDLHQISREDQDAFAVRSQQKAAAARQNGRLAQEILPLEIPQPKGEPLRFEQDEFIRSDSTLQALARLKPVFRPGGSVTAGNSSGINDGACALLVASERAVAEFRLRPRARLVASAVVGVEPRIMGIGPVGATRAALQRAGLDLPDLDVIEMNEAFAAQCLACLGELGLAPDDPRLNPNGGAIALGHPLGMSGARLLTTALFELEIRRARYALCTLCVGVGQGMAAIIERTQA